MRVLWVVNIVLPQVAPLVSGRKIATGGWINAMAGRLGAHPEIRLGIVTRAPVAKRVSTEIDGVTYYLVPEGGDRGYDVSEADCQAVLDEFAPDLLHVEGTEFAHANTFLKTWKGPNVVSLQGIINGYEAHQYGGLPILRMLMSGRQTLFACSLIYRKHKLFLPRLEGERATISLAKNILGRTTWDRAHAYAINPKAPYFSCNRILRETFYGSKWNIRAMRRHSIFVGNSSAPLKGAHFVMHAVAQLRQEYPDIRVTVAGEPPTGGSSKSWSKRVGYPAYLLRLIRDLGIESNIEFVGLIQAEEMARRLRESHAFVLSSTIENSPNTLGEAMIQGVPCVAAYSGGVPDMAKDGVEALHYRDNDPQVLAFQLKRLFDDDELATALSLNGAVRAKHTHDPAVNFQCLLDAYGSIMGVSLSREAAFR